MLVRGSSKGKAWGGEGKTHGRLPTAIGSSKRHEKRGKSGEEKEKSGSSSSGGGGGSGGGSQKLW